MEDNANQQADEILKRVNQRTLVIEYERAHDIVSRMMVWFAMPVAARNSSRRAMFQMCRDFMQTAHDPYSDE